MIGAALTHPSINVDKGVEVGNSQMQIFVSGCPESFQSTISRNVTIMAIVKTCPAESRVDNMIDTKFLGGCAVLWVIPWPTNAKMGDITQHLKTCDADIVFDR